MEFNNFKNLVAEEVEKRTGDNYRVKINEVIKNNGVVLSGITVMHEDSNISPTIYLNNYYEAYQEGKISLVAVVNDVLDSYNRSKIDKSIDVTAFMQYELIKGRIVYKLINAEKNKELLEDVPHISFHDLALVFECLVSEEKFGNATILIHNAHLKIWNKNMNDIYEQAGINTPKLLPYEIKNMRDVISEMIPESDFDISVFENSNSIQMYVLSNIKHIHGAACILYPDLLKDFSEAIGRSFYIIPSSIHETLLVPADDTGDSEYIRTMISDVNITSVDEEEILSYSVYFFNRDMGEIEVL